MNRPLVVFAGLPGTGKSTLARKLAKALPAFIKDFRLPTWEEVVSREYEPWNEEVLVIDTAKASSDEAIGKILSSLNVG